MSEIERLIREWPGEGVVARFDRPTGTWIFIALHDATLGPMLGGCRMRVYARPADGLRDAMRLAEGMTHKWAMIGFPFGGGKSVLAVPRPLEGEERAGLLRRFGRLLESLRGSYATGEDLGTTPEDMAVLAGTTRYVHGVDRGRGTAVDPGPYTALGVFTGIRAALRRLDGGDSLEGRSVLVQGVGDVGEPLAHLLVESGATVRVLDLDRDRVHEVARATGFTVEEAAGGLETECDVFAPCALGGVLDEETVPRLRCRVVAGSANNQLAHDGVAGILHERGILYAPDYVINAGGAIALPLIDRGTGVDEIRRRVQGIGATLEEIFAEAEERGESPVEAAGRRVRRILEAGPPAA